MKPPGDIKYHCEISHLKNATRYYSYNLTDNSIKNSCRMYILCRYIFVIAQKYTEMKSQTFVYYPETQDWIKLSKSDKTNTIISENRKILFTYLGSLHHFGKIGMQIYSLFNQTWQETNVILNYDFNNIYAINTIYI